MFEIELFDKDLHHDMLCEWWHKQKWPTVPVDILPPVGVVVKKDNEYLYGIFLYNAVLTPLAWLEYIVSNPDVEPNKKRNALNFGIEKIIEIGKQFYGDDEIKVIFTSSNNRGLVNSLVKSDFVIGDENMYQLVKNV